VLEVLVLPEVRRPPGVPAWQRGVTLLRGSGLPAIDRRVCLGLESSVHEVEVFLEEMRPREEDHRAWLAELIGIFAQTSRVVRQQHREVGAAVGLGGRQVVLLVDRADAAAELEPIEAGDDPPRDGSLRVELVSRRARWRGAPQPVLVLDLERLANLAA
jgi:chemotaxis signal transduction protein